MVFYIIGIIIAKFYFQNKTYKFMLNYEHLKSAPEEIISALVTLYNEGKFDDVLSRSSFLMEEYPETPTINNIIGAIALKKGDTETAIIHFRKEIDINP